MGKNTILMSFSLHLHTANLIFLKNTFLYQYWNQIVISMKYDHPKNFFHFCILFYCMLYSDSRTPDIELILSDSAFQESKALRARIFSDGERYQSVLFWIELIEIVCYLVSFSIASTVLFLGKGKQFNIK